MTKKKLNEDAVAQSPRALCEVHEVTLQIVEGTEKLGKVRVKGEFARSDSATQNGRVYSRGLWEREIGRLSRDLSSRKVLGELDHPQDGRTQLARVSHVITSLKLDENGVLIGEAEIVDTAKGRDLQALLKSGCRIGVSSRGHGSTRPTDDGNEQVMEDYKLGTFDFVGDPADQSAYPDAFFESKEKRMAKELKEGDSVTYSKEEVQDCVAEAVSDATAKTEEQLRDQYAAKLPALVEKLATETREAVTAELLADPNVAGAKTALEGLKEFIRPYVLPEDTEQVVTALEEQVSDLSKQVGERDLKIEQLQGEAEELEKIARQAGLRYFLERRLQETGEQEDLIRAAIGDVDGYPSLDALKEKVDAIEEELTSRQEEERALVEARESEISSRLDSERKKWDIQIADQRRISEAKEQTNLDLEAKVEKLEEGLELALKASKLQGARLYGESKIAGHPRAEEIRKVIHQSSNLDESQVDTIVDSFEIVARRNPSAETGGDIAKLRAQVKSLSGGGRVPTAIDEESPAETSVGNSDYNDLGQSLRSIRQLSGLGSA